MAIAVACTAPLKNAARAVWLVALSVPWIAFAQDVGADAADGAIPLPDGVTLRATQHAREPVTYTFEAEPGQNYLVAVQQQGLDFAITVEDAAGDARSFNSPLFRDEAEYVVLENTAAGQYRFTVVSEEPTHARGEHTISISTLGSTPQDTRQLEAWQLMSGAAAANAEEAHRQQSVNQYESVAQLWEELGETRLQAQAVYSAARVWYALGEWEASAARAKVAAELYQGLDVRTLQANAIMVHGYALMELAQLAGGEGQAVFDRALAAFDDSFAVHDALGNSYELAVVASNIGFAYFNRGNSRLGDYRRAEAHYQHAEQIFSNLGEWREALNVRHNTALINIDEGYAATAIAKLEGILAAIPEGEDRQFRGSVLANLGFAYLYAGNFDAALGAFSAALYVFRDLEHVENWEGFALRGLGATYYALGELERAGEYLGQALEKSSGDGRVRASVLANLGNLAYLRADYVKALDLHRRAVESTVSGADRAYRQAFMTRDMVALGRFREAIATADEALSGANVAAVTVADLSVELGYAFLGLGDVYTAAEHFDRALAVYDSLGLRAEQAKALKGRALAARTQGDLPSAIRFGEESLRRIERLRASVSSPELRAFYTAGQREYYEAQIDLLMVAHEETGASVSDSLLAALSVSERARARMTVELLAEASIDLDGGIPESVRNRRRDLYEEFNALHYQRDRMMETTSTTPELRELLSRAVEIENELSLLETETRKNNPLRASVAVPEALTAQAIQGLLDDRSVLLQYAIGKERSYVWVVTSDSVRAVELADRETIEAAARRAYDSLKSYQRASQPDLADTLATLSDLIIAPVAPLLESRERFIVAADGGLQYIPFGILPIIRNAGRASIMQVAEVAYVPSMSVLAARRMQKGRKQPDKSLAVFADPVFTETDPRFTRPKVTPIEVEQLSENATTRSSVSLQLDRLAATGAEARAIAKLVPEDSRFIATGFDASRDSVLATELSDYRIIHFATHGLIDSRYPGLSALALSRFDAEGLPQNGFLRLHDVYGMALNADLVVLSGCETALGRQIRGEGLIGLVQGFLYAGARNLVVSLWQVPDRVTAELMTRFYGYVLHDGLRPAEALRQAQLSIAAERRWRDPYFWGAFIVLRGE